MSEKGWRNNAADLDHRPTFKVAREHSLVVAWAKRVVKRWSRLTRANRGERHHPVAPSDTGQTVRSGWQSSWVISMLTATTAALNLLFAGSRTSDMRRTTGWWVQMSVLYHWLTAEPEQEVIIVDLRETRTVGPILTALDLGVACLVTSRWASVIYQKGVAITSYVRTTPIRAASVASLAAVLVFFLLQVTVETFGQTSTVVATVLGGSSVLGLRSTASWEDVREYAPIRLFIAALEPPEHLDE